MDRCRFKGGDNAFAFLKRQAFYGLACHISDKIETAVETHPEEEPERRDLPDRSRKDVSCAGPRKRGVRGKGHVFRSDATEDPLSGSDMTNRLDFTAFHRSRKHPVGGLAGRMHDGGGRECGCRRVVSC